MKIHITDNSITDPKLNNIYSSRWKALRANIKPNESAFSSSSIERVRSGFDLSGKLPVPSQMLLPTGIVLLLKDKVIIKRLQQAIENSIGFDTIVREKNKPADKQSFWLTPPGNMHLTVINYWHYKLSQGPINVIPDEKGPIVGDLVERENFYEFPYNIAGIMVSLDGTIIAKGHIDQQRLNYMRDRLLSELNLPKEMGKSVTHITLGRFLNPLSGSDIMPFINKIESNYLDKDFGTTMLGTLRLRIDGPEVELKKIQAMK